MTDEIEEPKQRKSPPSPAILVDRVAFRSVMQLVSAVIQAMGEEIEALRNADKMSPEMRKALFQTTSGHLHNVSQISSALQYCTMDCTDLEGTKPQSLN